MTREEAIEWMDWLKMDVRERGYNDIVAALNMAIKALEQEPYEDCVSRQDLLDKLERWDWQELYLPIQFKENIIDELPSVQPTRIHARWKAADNYNYRCSKCKHVSPWDYAYCPYCGEKMDLEENND